MKKKIVIVHFSPLELYPPVMNLLDYFSEEGSDFKFIVFSTSSSDNLKTYFNSNIEINRFRPVVPSHNVIIKISRYLAFYLSAFLTLLRIKPNRIIYFESLSALPAIWYKIWKNDAAIYAHYHEIVTLGELKSGRLLNRLINGIEAKYYPKFTWISQTNKTRISIFKDQYRLNAKLESFGVLPNFPPKSWISSSSLPRKNNRIIKLLHIGALSIKGMYLKEALDQFGSNPNYTIDFYSHNFSTEVKEAILQHKNCTIHGAINYQDIPKLKGLYDVGLVLYKALSSNVKYCAPNKVFEYLALDLDVWCSDKLITAKEYERLDCYPKMIMVDFTKLDQFNTDKAIDRAGLDYVVSSYVCEPEYETLLNVLNENTRT